MGVKRKTEKEEYNMSELGGATAEVLTIDSRLISFDVYFQTLMRKDSKIMLHHKAPMRQYAESNGISGLATEQEFDAVFSRY